MEKKELLSKLKRLSVALKEKEDRLSERYKYLKNFEKYKAQHNLGIINTQTTI